jgi:hypothetical protein
MKLCGAGASGYLLTMFGDTILKFLTDSYETLFFKVEESGLMIQEL